MRMILFLLFAAEYALLATSPVRAGDPKVILARLAECELYVQDEKAPSGKKGKMIGSLRNNPKTYSFTDKDAALLKDIPGIVRLELYDTSITGKALAHIKDLPDLEVLHIGKINLTNANLEHLKGHATLRRLTVGATAITDAL